MNEAVVSGRREVRNRVLRKVLVSFAIGTVAYVLTEFTGQPQIWSITLSVFIGGVTLVVQFLIGFENRLARVETIKEQHSARIEQMVETGFARINEATELFSLVESSALRMDSLAQLVRHATLIDPSAPPLVSRFALAEICRVSEFLKELGEGGDLMYEGEDRDWLLELTRLVETSIDATSLTTVDAGGRGYIDGGFWTTDVGRRYLEVQRAAVRRGVRVRRVFVILHDLDPAGDTGLAEQARLQREMGIEVRVLRMDSVPTTMRDTLYDFVLFDNVISYEGTPASHTEQTSRPTILSTRLELRPDRVSGRMQRFYDLWESAQVFGDPDGVAVTR